MFDLNHIPAKKNLSPMEVLNSLLNWLKKPLYDYSWNEDLVVRDDANKEVSGKTIMLHNQGSSVVEIGNTKLLPDDRMMFEAPREGYIYSKRLRIRFRPGAFTFNRPISDYPQLHDGNRLAITSMVRKDLKIKKSMLK